MNVLLSLLLLPFLGYVLAQTQNCASDGVCFAINIPSAHAASSDPELLIEMQAPNTAKWFAVGFGSQMAGTLMWVAWPYENKVILSSRLAKGHALPPVYAGPNFQILSSNVTSKLTTVQFKCTNCTTWSTGKLNVQSTSAGLIYAYGTNEPSNPSDSGSSFTQHLEHGNFNLNLKSAQTNSNNPPVISGAPTSPSSSGNIRHDIIFVHGALMVLVWALLFPLGAVTIRFFKRLSRAVAIHRGIQITALIILIGAGGVGFYLAWGHNFTLFHHFFGAAIIGAAVVQAFFGWYHHHRYVRDKPKNRRWFTHVHLWLGRTVILCGLANCGFGFIVAGTGSHWAFIWWVVCGACAGVYFFLAIIQSFIRRLRGRGKYKSAPTDPQELHPFGSNVNLVNDPPGQSYEPPSQRYEPPGERYEYDRYESGERYTDEPSRPYDPPS